jgi:hypothetical protein
VLWCNFSVFVLPGDVVNQGVSGGLLEGRNVIISFRSGDCFLQIWNRLDKSPFGLSPDHTTEEQQVHCWCMISPGEKLSTTWQAGWMMHGSMPTPT